MPITKTNNTMWNTIIITTNLLFAMSGVYSVRLAISNDDPWALIATIATINAIVAVLFIQEK